MKHTRTVKRTVIIFIIVITSFSGILADLEAADYGVGIIIGQPTGISFKINNFPVIGLAWAIDKYVQTQMDFWFFSRSIQEPVWWYLGVGGKVRFNVGDNPENRAEPVQVGVRVPVGLQLIFEEIYEVFVEIAPGIKLYEGTEFALDGGIGFRYHFLSSRTR